MNATLAQGIERAMSAAPDAGAIEFASRWYTWAEMSSVMNSLEDLLNNAGLDARTPVAVLMRNRPGMLAAALQVIKSGRCVLTVNPFQGPEKLAADIRSLRPAAIVADPQDWTLETLRAAAADAGSLGLSLELDAQGGRVEAVPGLDRPGAGPHQEPMPEVAVLMLSSGTTGPAKRIKLPSRQLEQAFARSAAYETRRPSSGDGATRTPSVLSAPLVHIGGLYFALDAVLAGRPVALLEKFKVDEYCRVLKAYRPKALSLPPAALRMLLDANVDPELFSSVKVVRAGSAPLSPEFKQRFEAVFKVPLLDVYGATEFAGAVAGWSLDDYKQFDKFKVGSVGRAQPGIELRVVDPDSGAVLPVNSVGVLEIRSLLTDPDRWIRTTDLAELDGDAFLYIRGRADDAIIRGGFKVLPREIEALLREHPAVHEACVVGLADDRLGAVPVAAVELKPDAPAIADAELLAWLRAKLVSYQVPTQLRIVTAIPRTPSLKISQHEVRGLFATDAATAAA